MQLEQVHRVFFVGIGGIGMSALAQYFIQSGKAVAGYDRTPSRLTRDLAGQGAELVYQEDADAIPEGYRNPENTLVVFTAAVPQDQPQLTYFRNAGFQIRKRAEVLGAISNTTRCLAVAGTHGKTTTSCILAHLLREAGAEFMAFLGGVSVDFGSNYAFHGTDYSVVEADEYDRSFLWLEPQIACITSMDSDHLDIYGDAGALQDAFRAFASQVRPGGSLVVRNGLPLEGLTYGFEDDAEYSICNLTVEDGGYCFDIRTPQATYRSVRFRKPGRHNLLNALAAFTMAFVAGFPAERLGRALESFSGVERRFSYQLNSQRLVYIDDYAHHPTEIDAVRQAVREMHPGREVLAVFQPHLFSRTRDFAAEFATSLSKFDRIWLLDIYPAREKPLPGITAGWLLEQIENPRKKLVKRNELIPELQREMPEVLLTLGAGDIGLEVKPIKQALHDALA